MLWRSLFDCVVCSGIIAGAVALGLFDAVHTDDGYSHYAEKPWTFLPYKFPARLKMPGNTFVNFGYIVIALYWIFNIRRQSEQKLISERQAYMFYVFAWSSLLYAPVQFMRIFTQNHRFAILDQWHTLPIFAWVTVWACFLAEGWNSGTVISIVMVSCSSYCFTLLKIAGYEDKGFEASLAIHILFAVYNGIKIYRMYPSRPARQALFLGVLCCTGFVVLKLSDQALGKYHPFFRVLSGHFWSKIADFMQIHYVCKFFFHVTQSKNSEKPKMQ